jgi:hypothetical protein
MGDNLKELQTRWPSLRDPLDDTAVAEMSREVTLNEDITDPLADLPPETVVKSDETAPVDEPEGDFVSSPQAGLVTILSVTDAQRNLLDSQLRNGRATDQQKECRGQVAIALQRWQRATQQVVTQSDLQRQAIEASNQERADRVAGRIPQRGGQRRLGSAVDSFAYHTRNSGRGAGGGRSFGRSAYPPSMRGRTVPKG